MLPRLSRQLRQTCFRGEASPDRIELPFAQRSDQVAPDCDLVSLTSGKSLLCQCIDPPIKRSTDLRTETGARKLDRLSRDQSPVEPGRPFRRHLLLEAEIRAHRERDPLPSLRILKS